MLGTLGQCHKHLRCSGQCPPKCLGCSEQCPIHLECSGQCPIHLECSGQCPNTGMLGTVSQALRMQKKKICTWAVLSIWDALDAQDTVPSTWDAQDTQDAWDARDARDTVPSARDARDEQPGEIFTT